MSRLARGAAAGAAGSVVMGPGLVVAEQSGLLGRKMPPRRLTSGILRRLGAPPRSRRSERRLAVAAHLGYGALCGALFGLGRRAVPLPDVAAGAVFGALVWSASYQGWIPELGLLPPPRRDLPSRPPAMLALHLLYGAALGWAWRASGRRSDG